MLSTSVKEMPAKRSHQCQLAPPEREKKDAVNE